MKKNIKSIQGRQVVPNPIGPECIRVTKVYDWVVLTNRDRNKVPIPEACFAAIEACRDAGNIVTATCAEVPGSRSAEEVSSVPANIPGVPGARIVTLAFHVHIQIEFLCDGDPICDFIVPVSFVDDVVLCRPEGTRIDLDPETIIFDVQCQVLLNQMLGEMVVIDVIVCKNIQVLADVTLEVQAKFCGPRDNIPMPEQELVCPPFPRFPEQCPTLFPPTNCLCQGVAEFTGQATITVFEGITTTPPFGGPATGLLDLSAIVCDTCNPDGSSLQVNFLESVGPTPSPSPLPTPSVDSEQSFTFVAIDFTQPECITTGGVLTGLTVTGQGVITPSGGVPENATFTLTLTDIDAPTGADAVILNITGTTTTVAISLTEVTNPGLDVEVDDCDRFPVID